MIIRGGGALRVDKRVSTPRTPGNYKCMYRTHQAGETEAGKPTTKGGETSFNHDGATG